MLNEGVLELGPSVGADFLPHLVNKEIARCLLHLLMAFLEMLNAVPYWVELATRGS